MRGVYRAMMRTGRFHGLASVLNLQDLELTPVQAWFGMVRDYRMESFLNDDDGGGRDGIGTKLLEEASMFRRKSLIYRPLNHLLPDYRKPHRHSDC